MTEAGITDVSGFRLGPGSVAVAKGTSNGKHVSRDGNIFTRCFLLIIVERKIALPGAGQVRIRVEACGVCHSDAATVEAQFPNLSYPRVPGHEVIGRIEEVGPGVTTWKTGQRVGVGFFGGEDGTCEPCRRGETVYCQNPIITGVTTDGGLCGNDDR